MILLAERFAKLQRFYYADEFNPSWFPTLRALWSSVGQQVMFPTPGQPTKRHGIGALNYHTGETAVLFSAWQVPLRNRRTLIGTALDASDKNALCRLGQCRHALRDGFQMLRQNSLPK